jgi:hypothetical protein
MGWVLGFRAPNAIGVRNGNGGVVDAVQLAARRAAA